MFFIEKQQFSFFFKDSPTIITLRLEKHLNPETERLKGTGFAWEEVLFIKVEPDSFVRKKYSEISGYCDLKAGIETVYSAFLRCALMVYVKKDSNDYYWPDRLSFYNIIKSPIIEDYLSGREYDPSEARRRYTPVSIIYTIIPDIMTFLRNDSCGYGFEDEAFDDKIDICDNDENHIQEIEVPGICKWLDDFRLATDFADTTIKEDFDIKEWHKKGLALAYIFRSKLSDDCDLWYDNPYEDKSQTIKHPLLIIKK